jgi:hypothetical protein
MFQIKDTALERSQIALDDTFTATQHAARVHAIVRPRLAGFDIEGAALFERLEARPGSPEPTVHLVSGDTEDPHEKRRLPFIGSERSHQGHEDLLRNVLGLSRVPKSLQSESIHPRKIRLIQEVEMFEAPSENLVDQFSIGIPGLLLGRSLLSLRVGHVRRSSIPTRFRAGPEKASMRGTPRSDRFFKSDLPESLSCYLQVPELLLGRVKDRTMVPARNSPSYWLFKSLSGLPDLKSVRAICVPAHP